METLVLAEHDGKTLRRGTLCALTVARDLASRSGSKPVILLLGRELAAVRDDARRFGDVVVADHSLLARPTAERYAAVIADIIRAQGVRELVAAASTFSRDILPRVAAVVDAAMGGDVTACAAAEAERVELQRPIHAGAAVASFVLHGTPQIITVRAAAFPSAKPLPESEATCCLDWPVNEDALPDRTEVVGLESRSTNRPELGEARVVVSGGRPLRSSEEFQAFVGGLADALQGAAGCTRALVDAGIAPNEWQVGQTGKVVSPELYVALGISGSVQHLAGMKNSRVIVAVNTDPDAPIFSLANYGLVGDLREIVPQLIRALAR